MNAETQATTMNGASVLARCQGTIYLRIPRELAQPIKGGCDCDYCKAHPEAVPMWDTLAISMQTPKGNDFSWTGHCPDAKSLWDLELKERRQAGLKRASRRDGLTTCSA